MATPRKRNGKSSEKRASILDPVLHRALRLQSVETARSVSELINDAVRDELAEDASDLAAFDISKEPELVRDAYGRDRFGQGCLLARRLVEHDVRFVEVVLDGWDTHNENFEAMEEKCPVLDRALATLLADLDTRGLLEETLVVWCTEFGRSPGAQNSQGRDHHPFGFSVWLAGGGIKGGTVHGATDELGFHAVENRHYVTDLHATVLHLLGLDYERLTFRFNGRDQSLVNNLGSIVHDVIA